MNFYTAAFLIVTVVLMTQMIKAIVVSSHSGKMTSAVEQRLGAMAESLAALEKRLKNVETIVTAKDFTLEQEFEELNRK